MKAGGGFRPCLQLIMSGLRVQMAVLLAALLHAADGGSQEGRAQ